MTHLDDLVQKRRDAVYRIVLDIAPKAGNYDGSPTYSSETAIKLDDLRDAMDALSVAVARRAVAKERGMNADADDEDRTDLMLAKVGALVRAGDARVAKIGRSILLSVIGLLIVWMVLMAIGAQAGWW